MIEKTFANNDLEIELTSYIDDKQNIWVKGKNVAKIIGYVDRDKAIRHVDSEDKNQGPAKTAGDLQEAYFINQSGFYLLILSWKLETAKKFKHWVRFIRYIAHISATSPT